MKDTRNTSRTIAALLAAAMMTSLAACGGDTGTTDTTASTDPAETTEAIDPAEISDLPDKDWGGEEFHVFGMQNDVNTQFSTFEVAVESENGEVVNDAIFRRNVAIEDRYNVKIVETKHNANTGGDAMVSAIRKYAMAGEDLYDLAFCAIDGIGTLAREGIFYDLNELDYIDFSKAWWNPEVNERMEVEGRLFFTNNDFTLRDKNRAYILNFNKRLVDEYKLPNYFDAVRDGKWTLDMMKEGCMAVANDINSNGEVDTDDVFGITLDSYNGGWALATGGGIQTLKSTDAGYQIVINSERTIDVLDKVLSITAVDYVGSSCDEWNGKKLPETWSSYWSFSGQVFNAGRALFTGCFPHSLSSRSANSIDDYGILPFPKYDEAQDGYINLADRYAMLVGIPSTSATPDFSAFMLEALGAEAYNTSLPAYIEVSCKTKYTYDEDSADMLDIIFGNIYYETALIYGISGLKTIVYDVMKAKENNFSSKYASIESKAFSDMEKMVEDILAVGQE
ncbi:MAG: hypothetical protein E7632_02615 [Ruminococcaceae bacterium]|nr:hypothetical protein [Oscillospiraceae bacterium]